MPAEANLTSILAAFSTPTIACFAAIIGYRQWKTAHTKLKLDLFERRVKVYESAQALLGSIFQTGKVGDNELFRFLQDMRHARWLFDDEIADYLNNEFYNKALDLQGVDGELEGMPNGEEKRKLLAKRRDIRKLLSEQYGPLEKKFSPFLQIERPSFLVRAWKCIPII